ncbi:MAG TPA: hypothetical protein VF085_04050 [Solirubrobacterales bacterium]
MLIAIVSLLLALVAGCGGGGDGSSSSTTVSKTWTGSKQAFVKKADAICSKNAKLIFQGVVKALYPAGINGANDSEKKEAVEKALVPGINTEIREIRALGFPSGQEDEVEAVLSSLEEELERAQSEPTEFLLGQSSPFVDSKQAAEEYGFTACGSVA